MIGFYNYTVVLTYIGLLSGIIGILNAASGNNLVAIICLLICGLCDMFDGKIARTKKRTKQEKSFGIQIDSLSDVICFGVLPSVIGYSVGIKETWLVVVSVLFPLAALIRLAYFNVTEEEMVANNSGLRKKYLGLPVTASSLIFPILYCFKNYVEPFYFLYAMVLFITGILFLTKFEIKKPKEKEMYVLLGMGIVVFLIVIIFGG